jgi:hypothetical protein
MLAKKSEEEQKMRSTCKQFLWAMIVYSLIATPMYGQEKTSKIDACVIAKALSALDNSKNPSMLRFSLDTQSDISSRIKSLQPTTPGDSFKISQKNKKIPSFEIETLCEGKKNTFFCFGGENNPYIQCNSRISFT